MGCTASTGNGAASSYKHVILGGGVSAGYAAKAFVEKGLGHGELCIVTDEEYVSYERPALSKGYLDPAVSARLPGFHCCVGGGGEAQTPEWYEAHGIDFKIKTVIIRVDLSGRALYSSGGEKIMFENLIIATGCRAVKMTEVRLPGADIPGLYYIRSIVDADCLLQGIEACKQRGKRAVVLGGGYIGMEAAAVLQKNGLDVTLILSSKQMMPQLFTKEMAAFYEEKYVEQGVNILKGARAAGFGAGTDGNVAMVVLSDGSRVPTDGLVVVGVGARPNSGLVEGQVQLFGGGIRVDDRMRTSHPKVWAIGDVAAFPSRNGGKPQRQEHVTNARLSAAQAVSDIMEPGSAVPYDYLPYFYSRVFDLTWGFYGSNKGSSLGFGDPGKCRFGTVWVKDGKVIGGFLEGGNASDLEGLRKLVRDNMPIPDKLKENSLDFMPGEIV